MKSGQTALSTRFSSRLRNLYRRADRPAWRNFGVGIGLLAISFLIALYSVAARETGHLILAVAAAVVSLALAGFVAVTIVPYLARRTPLRWLLYQIDYKLTKEGVIYLAAVFVLIIAALNTGNNLLFLILSSLLAGILVSGVLSRIVLTGVNLKLLLPDHIFAEQPVLATLTIENDKLTMPSFSLRVSVESPEGGGNGRRILRESVYFPYIARMRAASQKVELLFPHRGLYTQDAFRVSTKFPFGFLLKTRHVPSTTEIVVYPRVQPTEEFYEILPMISGEMESFAKGRGHDLYSIRDYAPTDSARHVDWKATAKAQALKVREFSREDERRLELIFDPHLPRGVPEHPELQAEFDVKFERAVALCACLAWHFHEINSQMRFCSDEFETPFASASQLVYDVLRHLAFVQAKHDSDDSFLRRVGRQTDTFKIVLTSRPRGSIPTNLWASAYMVFMDSL